MNIVLRVGYNIYNGNFAYVLFLPFFLILRAIQENLAARAQKDLLWEIRKPDGAFKGSGVDASSVKVAGNLNHLGLNISNQILGIEHYVVSLK